MDFRLTEEQALLRDTARRLLHEQCQPTLLRSHLENRRAYLPLWEQIGDFVALGDGPCTDLCVFLDELGYVAAPGPFVAAAVLALPLLRAIGHPAADAVAEGTLAATSCIDGALVVDADIVDLVAFIGPSPEVTVRRSDETAITMVESVDSSRRYAQCATVPDAATHDVDPLFASAYRDRVIACTAADLVGTSRRMFDMALAYAKERVQFDKPIGSFQAIQHKLADMALAVERATAAVHYAAMTVDAAAPDRTIACHSAKAAANVTAQHVLKDAIQIHGGVGYTLEHDLQLFLRRATMSATQFGTTTFHHDKIAEVLFA